MVPVTTNQCLHLPRFWQCLVVEPMPAIRGFVESDTIRLQVPSSNMAKGHLLLMGI